MYTIQSCRSPSPPLPSPLYAVAVTVMTQWHNWAANMCGDILLNPGLQLPNKHISYKIRRQLYVSFAPYSLPSSLVPLLPASQHIFLDSLPFLAVFLVTLLRKQLLKCQLGEKFASTLGPCLLLFKLTGCSAKKWNCAARNFWIEFSPFKCSFPTCSMPFSLAGVAGSRSCLVHGGCRCYKEYMSYEIC